MLTIADILQSRGAFEPDRLAYGFLENRGRELTTYTYADLLERVQRVVAALEEHSSHQDVVGCLLPPGIDFLATFYGCLWAGRIAVPLPPPRRDQGDGILPAVIRHSGMKLCFADAELAASLAAQPETGSLLSRCRWVDTAELPDAPFRPPSADSTNIAYLQYTSGSTGTPKGVMVTHANLLANSAQIAHGFSHSRESVGVIWLPPHHDMGLVGGILQPLYVGFPVYLMSPQEMVRSPATWLAAISRFRATTSGGPNFGYEMCLKRVSEERRGQLDLSSWQVAFCGAEPISMETLDRFAETFSASGFSKSAFVPCYGLAEATLMVSTAEPGAPPHSMAPPGEGEANGHRYVSCGTVPAPTDVAIVDPATMHPVPDGSRGEVWISGPSVAAGYWAEPESSEEVFHARMPGSDREYLRTGDIGFIADGELFICGRLRSMVIVRGANHSLEDIERTASAAHPDLLGYQCAAFVTGAKADEGVAVLHEAPMPLRRSEEAPAVVARISELIILEHGIRPAEVRLVPLGSLPRTRSGKVRRDACREQLERGSV